MLAFISVVSAVFNFLIPDGSVKKVYKTLCAAVLAFSLISSFARADIESASKEFDKRKTEIYIEDRYNSYVESALLSAAEKEFENLILKEVSEFMDGDDINVECYASQTESIDIKVKIKGIYTSAEKEELVKRIKTVTGSETEFVFEGDNDDEGEK